MAIALITNWLNGNKDYRHGVELYNEYGASNFLKEMFCRSQTKYNQTKLVEVLRELNESTAIVKAPDPEAKKFFPSSFLSDKEYAGLPDGVKKLKSDNHSAYKEMGLAHFELILLAEKEEKNPLTKVEIKRAKDLAFEVLDLQDRLQLNWDKLDYWEQHKELPVDPEPSVQLQNMSRDKLIMRRNNLRSRVSKGDVKFLAELSEIIKILGKC